MRLGKELEICVPLLHLPTHLDVGTLEVQMIVCALRSHKNKYIHMQNRARAWHSSLIAALLKLVQNTQIHKHNNDCIEEQVMNSSVLAVSAPLQLTKQSLDVDYHLEQGNLHSASSTVLCLPSPPPRCF